jgi:hypothetical protein
MKFDCMESLEGWIEALQGEFIVNTAKAREKAKDCQYDPTEDKSVMDYFYKKIDLLRMASAHVEYEDLVDDTWLRLRITCLFKLSADQNSISSTVWTSPQRQEYHF